MDGQIDRETLTREIEAYKKENEELRTKIAELEKLVAVTEKKNDIPPPPPPDELESGKRLRKLFEQPAPEEKKKERGQVINYRSMFEYQ